MAADPKRVKELFMAMSEAPAAERAAVLDRECGGDAELRQRVDALLNAHEEPNNFLRPAGGTGAYQPADGLAVGQTFAGRFKLREELGEGGMGVVFVADQIEPVQRRVALKVVKAGADSARVLARFEQERQALALMDHPNIAKVLDAGMASPDASAPGGIPYFVMELIKGVPLTKYCDEAKLTPRQRLELFIPVCQAVQHAHQKGIIHRDLKPSNILIGLYDGKPMPKVIDFGVAKATGPRISEHSVYTEVGSIIGTLEYMSPEQAELNNLDIDTRSDIYALGVILYELLTGTVPFSRKELQSSGFAEMLRIIKEKEPPKPSTRLSASRELPNVAAVRHTEPAKLSKLIRGDLDWITMKALEKDRSRRYETANGLALDVQRFLDDEPVLAGPPSAGYRLRKFVRRNRGPVLAAVVVVLSLVGGVIGTTWGLIQAERARQEAVASREAEAEQRNRAEVDEQKALAAAAAERTARAEAEERRQETEAALGFVENKVLAAARPVGQNGGLGHDVTLRRAIEAAVPFVEESFKNQPHVEARLRTTLGISFLYIGDARRAAEQFEAARGLCSRHRGPDHADTLRSMSNLAVSYSDLGRHADALKLCEETLALQKAKLGPAHPDTLRSMNSLANSYSDLGRHADALKLREETLALQKAKLGPAHPNTLQSMNNLANSYFGLGRHADAIKLYEETLALRKATLGPDHPDTLTSMNNLAASHTVLGRHTDAIKLYEETLALRKAKLGPDHPDTLASMNNLAVSYAALGRHADALKLCEEALALQKAKLGPDHPNTLASMNNLANGYFDVGRRAEALKLRKETLALQKAKLGPDHPGTLGGMVNLANSYNSLGRYLEAIDLLESALPVMRKTMPGHQFTFNCMAALAISYAALGRHADALKLYEEALALQKARLGPDHPDTLRNMWRMATTLIALDRGAEAVPVIDDCLRLAAGKDVDPKLIPGVIALRLRHFQKAKDAAGCQQTCEMWEKLNRADAGSFYRAACWRAAAAGVDRETPGADASRLANEDADRAMDWLRKAVAAGYKDAAHLKANKDLDALHGRDDFRKLLADLQASAPRANEPRTK